VRKASKRRENFREEKIRKVKREKKANLKRQREEEAKRA
jgi:hypothetical protein